MTAPSDGRCSACGCVGPNPGTEALSPDECAARSAALAPAGMWALANDGSQLTRRFVAKNFAEAMGFLNAAAAVAERPDVSHHPDLHLTTYRDVEVGWSLARNAATAWRERMMPVPSARRRRTRPCWSV